MMECLCGCYFYTHILVGLQMLMAPSGFVKKKKVKVSTVLRSREMLRYFANLSRANRQYPKDRPLNTGTGLS